MYNGTLWLHASDHSQVSWYSMARACSSSTRQRPNSKAASDLQVGIRESVTPEAQEAAKRRIARNAPPNLPDVNEARSALEHPANIADITSTRCNGGAPPTGARYRSSQCSAGKGGFWRALKSAAMDVWAIRYTVSVRLLPTLMLRRSNALHYA